MSVPAEEIKTKMTEYSRFVSEKLRPELESAQQALDVKQAEVADYEDLNNRLQEMQKDGKTTGSQVVNLGHDAVYCNASYEVNPTLFVHVGMGFHAELTVPEALDFVRRRIEFLKENVLPGKESQVRQIAEHVQCAADILKQLEGELRRAT